MKITDIFDIPAPEKRIPVPYVIAEAGVNHEGSMDIARRLIDEAAEGGADAIKFQTYIGRTSLSALSVPTKGLRESNWRVSTLPGIKAMIIIRALIRWIFTA